MSDWFWILAYAFGAGWTWLAVARRYLNSVARENLRFRAGRSHWADDPLVDGEDRGLALLIGFLAALIWPLALLALVVMRSSLLTTEVEKQEEQRIELEKLRKLAREHNLPMPGDER
jgi:hypothetical protein